MDDERPLFVLAGNGRNKFYMNRQKQMEEPLIYTYEET